MWVMHMPVQPQVVIFRLENDRHPFMDRLHQIICFCGQYATGLNFCTIFCIPSLPYSSKTDKTTVKKTKVIWLFMIAISRQPHIETRSRNDTPIVFDGMFEQRFLMDSLTTSIYRGMCGVLRPAWE
jgi:hypothetical protein